jgi:hypothetical protein
MADTNATATRCVLYFERQDSTTKVHGGWLKHEGASTLHQRGSRVETYAKLGCGGGMNGEGYRGVAGTVKIE